MLQLLAATKYYLPILFSCDLQELGKAKVVFFFFKGQYQTKPMKFILYDIILILSFKGSGIRLLRIFSTEESFPSDFKGGYVGKLVSSTVTPQCVLGGEPRFGIIFLALCSFLPGFTENWGKQNIDCSSFVTCSDAFL